MWKVELRLSHRRACGVGSGTNSSPLRSATFAATVLSFAVRGERRGVRERKKMNGSSFDRKEKKNGHSWEGNQATDKEVGANQSLVGPNLLSNPLIPINKLDKIRRLRSVF